MSEFGPEFLSEEVVDEKPKLTLLQGGKKDAVSLSETEYYIKQHNQFIDAEVDAKGDFLPLPLWRDDSP